ncbi:MAG: hypothetical protein HYR91_12110 [Flavobacteriia bacterium]|nr:hypothetical protein [Flavobacteriia bacterium]
MKYKEYINQLIKNNGINEYFRQNSNKRIYSEWIYQLENSKTPLELELPWITIDSKNYLVNYLENKKNTKIFEYGSGGSSLFFLKYANEVISVEHDIVWYNRVFEIINKKSIFNWKGFNIEPELNDSNKSNSISNPDDYFSDDLNFSDKNFKKYVSKIDDYENGFFDIVLIDGRSRPSCIKHSVDKVKVGGLLVVDNSERDYYYYESEKYLKKFKLVFNKFSALICTPQFTKTNIYKKIK